MKVKSSEYSIILNSFIDQSMKLLEPFAKDPELGMVYSAFEQIKINMVPSSKLAEAFIKNVEALAAEEANNNEKHAHVGADYQDGIFYGFREGYNKAVQDFLNSEIEI